MQKLPSLAMLALLAPCGGGTEEIPIPKEAARGICIADSVRQANMYLSYGAKELCRHWNIGGQELRGMEHPDFVIGEEYPYI